MRIGGCGHRGDDGIPRARMVKAGHALVSRRLRACYTRCATPRMRGAAGASMSVLRRKRR